MTGFFYLFVIGVLLVLLAAAVVGLFFSPTALAVASFAGFFFSAIFEIFLVRPLYLVALALIRKCLLRRKNVDYKKLDQKESLLENTDLMDEANFWAA